LGVWFGGFVEEWSRGMAFSETEPLLIVEIFLGPVDIWVEGWSFE